MEIDEVLGEHECANALAERPATTGVTLVGLIFESSLGLRRALAPAIECDLGISGLAVEVLIRLERSPGKRLRMTDLAAQTGLTPGGLTRAVDRLVEAGLVSRCSGAEDRRSWFAVLTSLGEERIAGALERHEREIASIVADVFDESDAESLVNLLRRLRDRVHPEAARISDALETTAR